MLYTIHSLLRQLIIKFIPFEFNFFFYSCQMVKPSQFKFFDSYCTVCLLASPLSNPSHTPFLSLHNTSHPIPVFPYPTKLLLNITHSASHTPLDSSVSAPQLAIHPYIPYASACCSYNWGAVAPTSRPLAAAAGRGCGPLEGCRLGWLSCLQTEISLEIWLPQSCLGSRWTFFLLGW